MKTILTIFLLSAIWIATNWIGFIVASKVWGGEGIGYAFVISLLGFSLIFIFALLLHKKIHEFFIRFDNQKIVVFISFLVFIVSQFITFPVGLAMLKLIKMF